MFDKLSHVMVFVQDMKRATEWYCGVLGFSVVFGHDEFTMLRHAATGVRVDLHASGCRGGDKGHGEGEKGHGTSGSKGPGGRDPEAPLPYLATKTFDDMLAQLKAKGVKTTEPRSEGGSPRFLSFYDSEGNAWGLEEVRPGSHGKGPRVGPATEQ